MTDQAPGEIPTPALPDEATAAPTRRVSARRMTGSQRREQLLDVGRALFAEKGFDATTVEEIAAKAQVSKPVVYEHFGGKEGLYDVIVEREVITLRAAISQALTDRGPPRMMLERAAMALLDYVDESSDGFRILVRDSPAPSTPGAFSSVLGEVANQVELILVEWLDGAGFDRRAAPMYARMLVGMVSLTGQWWLDTRRPRKAEVAAHLVNLAWNGLSRLEPDPRVGGMPPRRKP